MKSKILIIIAFCNLQLATIECFSQNWEWSSVLKGQMGNIDVKIDKYKNVFLGGDYSVLAPPFNASPLGLNDIYIIKYDPLGNVIWVKNFGGENPQPVPPDYITYYELLNCMYLDSINNSLYISGIFYNTIQFGAITLNSYSPNSLNYFLSKMDLDGNIIWAKRVPINISGVVTDSFGDVYFCGGKIGTQQLDSAHVISNGSCIVKLNSNGDCIWAKHVSNDFFPRDIKLHNFDIILNGRTNNDTIVIDTITKYVPLNSYWSNLADFDNNGNVKWLTIFGGNNSQCGDEFSIDNNGNSYSTGYFMGTGYFGNDTLNATVGQKNMFLAKHDSLGHLIWANQINATSSLGNCVSNIVDNCYYVTGLFKGNATFNNTITASSTQDMFLAKYNLNGVCTDVKYFGKAEGKIVVQDQSNSAIVFGTYSGNISIGSSHYTSNFQVFVSKLSGLTNVSNTSRLINTNNLLTIYANPNTGKCNITIPEEFSNEKNLSLQIFDLKGNQIQQAKIELLDNKIKVNIEAEAKGIYNAVLTNGKKNYSGRIIFE